MISKKFQLSPAEILKVQNLLQSDNSADFSLAFQLLVNYETPEVLYQKMSNRPEKIKLCLEYNYPHVLENKQIQEIQLTGILSPTIFKSLCKHHHLKSLTLTNNQISHFPKDFKLNPCLEEFSCRNPLHEFPQKHLPLTHLRTLKLRKAKFTTIPPGLSAAKNLEVLMIAQGNLQTIPNNLGNLSKLKVVELTGNQIKSLPLTLAQLIHLKYFYAVKNQLCWLPSSFGQLKNLESLDLSFNLFREVPPVIFQLEKLSYLGLAGNQIHQIPIGLRQLQALEEINVSGNRLSEEEIKKLKEMFPQSIIHT